MRRIAPALAEAQRHPDVDASVRVVAEARGQSHGAPMVRWSEVARVSGWTPSSLAVRQDGTLWWLRVAPEDARFLEYVQIAAPQRAESWLAPGSWTRTHTDPAPWDHIDLSFAWHPDDSDWGLISYIRAPDGVISGWGTLDGGASWVTSMTWVPPSYDQRADRDIHVYWMRNSNLATVSFTTVEPRPVIMYWDGVNKVEATGFAGWGYGGIVLEESDPSYWRLLVYRSTLLTAEAAASRQRIAWAQPDGSYGQIDDVDGTNGGLHGLHFAWSRYREVAQGVTMGILAEAGLDAGCYACISGYVGGGSTYVDEPVLLGVEIDRAPGGDMVGYENDIYLMLHGADGNTVVLRGEAVHVPQFDVPAVEYKYDTSEGDATIVLPGATPPPPLHSILRVERRIEWHGRGGRETLRWLVLAVEAHREYVKILAVDPVGWLARYRSRRPVVVADGVRDQVDAARMLAARAGMRLDGDPSLQAVTPLRTTIQPGERGTGSAYRILSQNAAWLLPRNDGQFALYMRNASDPDATNPDYADVPHIYGDDAGAIPLHDAWTVADTRRYGVAYVLGLASTDPEAGSALGQALGPLFAGTRPIPVSLTNTLFNSVDRVQQGARAEAHRQQWLAPDFVIEAGANLALELYDVIEVYWAEMDWRPLRARVIHIVEEYKQGRLRQKVYGVML